jgi:hypothetical protein
VLLTRKEDVAERLARRKIWTVNGRDNGRWVRTDAYDFVGLGGAGELCCLCFGFGLWRRRIGLDRTCAEWADDYERDADALNGDGDGGDDGAVHRDGERDGRV